MEISFKRVNHLLLDSYDSFLYFSISLNERIKNVKYVEILTNSWTDIFNEKYSVIILIASGRVGVFLRHENIRMSIETITYI